MQQYRVSINDPPSPTTQFLFQKLIEESIFNYMKKKKEKIY